MLLQQLFGATALQVRLTCPVKRTAAVTVLRLGRACLLSCLYRTAPQVDARTGICWTTRFETAYPWKRLYVKAIIVIRQVRLSPSFSTINYHEFDSHPSLSEQWSTMQNDPGLSVREFVGTPMAVIDLHLSGCSSWNFGMMSTQPHLLVVMQTRNDGKDTVAHYHCRTVNHIDDRSSTTYDIL